MSYSVSVTARFDREAKRLKKKYPSLKKEVAELIALLEREPEQGTPIGKRCFKVRLAVRSKGKGKSGGARVITCVIHVVKAVHLMMIFDKSEQETITDTRLQDLLNELPPTK